MTKEKELLMNQTFRQFMDAGLGLGSADVLNDIVNDKVMGFGTTIDEKIFNLDELKALIARQKEQSKDIDLNWEIKPLSHYTSTDENTAFFADELLFHATIGGETIEMYLRFSVVLSYVNNEWKVIHWHGSKPENVQSEEDTFGIETWKSKAEELEKIVAERTAKLSEKYRELEIEASLERVRTTAMAMQVPEDLLKICEVLFKELQAVGLKKLRNALIHTFNDEEKYFTDYDYSEFTGGCISRIPYSGHPAIDKFIKEVRSSNDAFTEITISGKELEDWREFRKSNNEAPDSRLEETSALYYYFYSVGPADIGISTLTSISDQERELLKRYRNVFDLAYRRYLDIEQAIAQTREAQIEAALERVRAKTMAMQQSGELAETASLLFHQVKLLGIDVYTAGFTIWDEEEENLVSWACNADGSMNPPFLMPYKENDWHYQQYTSWKNGEDFIAKDLNGEAMKSYFQYLRSFPLLDEAFKISIAAGHPMPERQVHNVANFSQGNLLFITYVPVPRAHDIFKRFGKVFEQTYTRFLDLQKAEAQAREAQIESALERVRSRSLAMHHTSEIQSVIHAVHSELLKLNISIFGGSFIVINKDVDDRLYAWGAGATAETTTKVLVPDFGMSFCTNLIEGIKTGPGFFTEEFSQQQKITYFAELFNHQPWSEIPDEDKNNILESDGAYTRSVSVLDNTSVFIVNQNGRKFSAEENDILRRFSKVFEQSYTRFLDLQKAEAQAREAQINLAVERVRAKALAMYSSEEILEVVFKLKEEVMNLNIPNVMAATIHMIEKNGKHRMWDISSMEAIEGKLHLPLDISFRLAETDPNLFVRRVWTNTEKYFLVTQDEKDLKRTTQWLKDNGKTKEADETVEFINATQLKKLYHPTIQLNSGRMCIDLLEEPSAEIESILTKMGAAFDLAYTRFEDLKNSEAQLKEAQTEAALEKVRARTMAMQHSDELADASRLLEEEVRKLGIETWGCAFHIYDEENTDEHPWDLEWFTSPAGMLPFYKTPRENVFLKYYNEGKKGTKLHIEEIGPGEIIKHYDYLKSIPIMGDALKEMSGAGVPLPQIQFDHVAFFKQGHLLFITYKPVPEAHDIFIRFAKIFDQTYTRFLDLKMAEAQAVRAEKDLVEIKAAREKAEEALTDLRATQKQLVQSEKMASLGELTAGIAHEIQNPLNFVNNFSEVSKELLDEMKDALENGDAAEAKELATDIIQNLEKITHHGKRADAIVKGMLQHSRASSNQKELTDINALADEYLRLAYHGLRAKDKSFNATLKTDFDKSLGNVSIIPQDIGRAVLNLITNAFHAVAEKKKATPENFEPTVCVSTKKRGDSIELTVADNGNGIPQNIIDKIFQPFFTTKPTGQGTGLGLSMSYDIITKGHNGALEVESTAGKGSEFIIKLPIENTHENISSR